MTDPNTLGVNKKYLHDLMRSRDELIGEIDACTKELSLLSLASLLLSFTELEHVERSLINLPGRLGRLGEVYPFEIDSSDRHHMAAYQYADALRGMPRLYVIGVLTSFMGVDQLSWVLPFIREGKGRTGVELL